MPSVSKTPLLAPLSLVLALTSAYTFARYVVFGGVDPVHLPVFLLNKSISLAAVAALLMVGVSYARRRPWWARRWGMASWHLAVLHVLLSLSILSAAYYEKFFDGGRMNLVGELSMLTGVAAIYGYWRAAPRPGRLRGRAWWIIGAAGLIAAHLVVMGLDGWLKPSGWHGGLPPISLVAFVLALGALALLVGVRLQAGCGARVGSSCAPRSRPAKTGRAV